MTIKQQGGVFGRNPTFNNVEVDGKLNGGDLRGDSLGIGVDSLTYQAEFAKAGSPSYMMVNTTGGSASGLLIGAEGTLNAIYSGTGPGNLAGKPLFLYQGFTLVCNTTAAGNLAFPSGQGIDFSATAGTGTSELFDDYEEGTWTPVDASGTLGAALAFAVGNYSKIGRMVFASFMITYPASANTNTASIGGLPFSSMTGNQTSGSAIAYTDFGSFISVLNSAGGSTMLLGNASGAFLTNANMSGKIIRGTVSYMTA